MKYNDDRDETMSCTEVSHHNTSYYHKRYHRKSTVGVHQPAPLTLQQHIDSSFESNTSCELWEEEKNSKEQLVYPSAALQRNNMSQQWMDSPILLLPSPRSSSPPLPPSCPSNQLVNPKLLSTYHTSYLIVFMCASATLLATGIWCLVTFPSSKLLELKWNTLYTLILWHSNIVAIVLGSFLLFWIFVMGMWLANKSFKLWVKMGYWIWLFFTCGLATSFGILNCFIMSHSVVDHTGEHMWKQMISNQQESILCNIQQLYHCQGWNSQVDESLSCSPNHSLTTALPFCTTIIYLLLQHYFLPQTFAFLMVSFIGWIELVSFIVLHKKNK
ncbi:hypothetical protein GpartN1_g5631.t1 [Galdieria partita]|uniref:Uncharacterized protein n=1 Tax=Galdieria partita TaxID=83374 RepID=A0A9C7USV7_9RHOD|nr:hypothetical protein GpartN1_g5631.t1 [Galdieria partita]